jgi:hypothetical protein
MGGSPPAPVLGRRPQHARTSPTRALPLRSPLRTSNWAALPMTGLGCRMDHGANHTTAPMPCWAPTSLSTEASALACNGRTAFAALADGRVARSDDGGLTWESIASGPELQWSAIAIAGETVLLAWPAGIASVGRASDLVPARGLPAGVRIQSLAGTEDMALAGTACHGVLTSINGGRQWSVAGRGLPYDGRGLSVHSVLPIGRRIFAVHALGVHVSDDHGARWRPTGFGFPQAVGGGPAASSAGRLVTFAGNSVFVLDDGIWSSHGPAPPKAQRLVGASGALYALTAAGNLFETSAEIDGWRDMAGSPGPIAHFAVGQGRCLAAIRGGGVWRRDLAPASAHPAGVCVAGAASVLDSDDAFFKFTLRTGAHVRLVIIDALDREAACLADAEFASGAHRLGLHPGRLEAGLYHWRIEAGATVVSRPLLVLPRAV